jgi:hypothetical protein
MTSFRWIGSAVVLVSLALVAPAQADTMVFIKKSDIWIARDDGARQVRLTRDGTRRRP